MSWASLASNELVTYTDAFDAIVNNIFGLKQTLPSTLECMTKADAALYLYIDESYGPFVALSSTEEVTKADLQPVSTTYFPVVIYTTSVAAASCGGSGGTTVIYLDIGTGYINAYTDTALTTPFVGGSVWYYSPTGMYMYRINNSGDVTGTYNCRA
jgi:hypothetical protein